MSLLDDKNDNVEKLFKDYIDEAMQNSEEY